MAAEAPDQARGSTDCGTFLLDCVGSFTEQQLQVIASPQRRETSPEIDAIIESTWLAELECARQAGRRLYDGQLFRLIDHTCHGQQLTLTVGPVSFKEFLGTNLTHAYLRYLHGPEVLGDVLGVSAAVRSRDGFLVLGRRSQRVAYHAGRIHPIGGVVESAGPDQPPPHPARVMIRELTEEMNLAANDVETILCLGLVRDKHIVQPELIFDVVAGADVSQLRRLRQKQHLTEEHTELLPVRDHPAAVVGFIEQNFRELTPVGLAALLLHGLHHWGSGWFATTRGYLRSVI
ncbi:MAG TPA: hypothetical protein VNA25_27505 [Phycisphaerae bacterium]|nr:hypothetical protein [Phycisphaerae bacterium]HUT61604.1 hypothetical protein [Phycisphaerae bacterium]